MSQSPSSPASKPTNRPAGLPASKPATQPSGQPASRPASQPTKVAQNVANNPRRVRGGSRGGYERLNVFFVAGGSFHISGGNGASPSLFYAGSAEVCSFCFWYASVWVCQLCVQICDTSQRCGNSWFDMPPHHFANLLQRLESISPQIQHKLNPIRWDKPC